jgi:transcriptional regulator with XRE-family HTH domain
MKKRVDRPADEQIRNVVCTLRVLRLGRGITQSKVAEKCGVVYNHVSLVESGHRYPRIHFLEQYASVFGLKLHIHIGISL